MQIEDLPEAGTPEWHEMRRRGVGASEVAAACGLSRWKTRYDLWRQKREGTIWEGNDATRWGQRNEQWILADWADANAAEIASTQSTYRDERWPNVWATLDAVATLADGSECVVEAKSTTSRNAAVGDDDTDECPQEWLIQVQVQMLLSGIHQARVACLIDGFQPRQFRITYDEATAIKLVSTAQAWFTQASECQIPPASWANPTQILERNDLFGSHETIDLRDSAVGDMWDDYEEMGRDIKKIEERREQLKAECILAMGDANRALIDGGRELVISRQKRKGFTVKPSSFVTLTMRKVKT